MKVNEYLHVVWVEIKKHTGDIRVHDNLHGQPGNHEGRKTR